MDLLQIPRIENYRNKRFVVGLSGGVDSAVSALLVSKLGQAQTVFMLCYDGAEGCTTQIDMKDAVSVAAALGLKFSVVDLQKEFKEKVLDYFIESYDVGITPNPDVMCNTEIKFGVFIDYVNSISQDAVIVTGHYSRILKMTSESHSSDLAEYIAEDSIREEFFRLVNLQKGEELYLLASAIDQSKDQSYFLYGLYGRNGVLSRSLFPLGWTKKSDTRSIAHEYKLPNSDKADSVGVCFVGDISLRQFMRENVKLIPGSVVDQAGNVIGTHKGLPLYTIGQRHGFEVVGYDSKPKYVIKKDAKYNTLTVGPREMAFAKFFSLRNLVAPENLPFEKIIDSDLPITVRIRHLGDKHPCKIEPVSHGEFRVNLEEPVFGVAPGQSAVFYLDEIVLGGGIIS